MRNGASKRIKRKIIHIDEEKCDGCGQCVSACAEEAIRIVNGKAKLISDRFCDSLGACLGHCPQDAISIEERESEPFDEEAVAALRAGPPARLAHGSGRPGARAFEMSSPAAARAVPADGPPTMSGALAHWPVQLHLLPPTAPFLKGADLLICAPCVPVAMPDFHARLLAGRAVAIACPKLDDQTGYMAKLAAMFANANLNSVTVARMSVPCCGGLLRPVHQARDQAGAALPIGDMVIGLDGRITETNTDSVTPDRIQCHGES